MQLQLDPAVPYAVALEGGGARGAYQIGVWKALDEAGIRYNAVAGTSVGALNGALMAMRDLNGAERLWKSIRFSKVMEVDDGTMKKLMKGNLLQIDFKAVGESLKKIVSEGGFDVTPLKNLIEETVDETKIRTGDVELFINTYSVTDHKELDLDAKGLADGELSDMLLASAYFPAFKHEKLRGKLYTDGGVQNVLPLSSLVERGYTDILAVRLYGFGISKRVTIPKGTTVTTVAPNRDLGNMLNFDAESCTKNLTLGYFDAKRVLYGLYGERYYIDRTWSEQQAYDLLRENLLPYYEKKGKPVTLRALNEEYIPKLGREVSGKGDYYDLLIRCLETAAEKLGIDEFSVMTDEDLYRAVKQAGQGKRTRFGILKYLR